MKAAIYARFSSDNQREESITAQLRACREYCARRDYSIVAEYFDEAMTATNDNRPQWQEMLKQAQKRSFDVIIMHKLDRGARNEYDYYINKARLSRVGVSIEYATQQFDMNTPEGQLMENSLVGIAAYYSRNLAKEVRKGQKENALKCKFNGGKPPIGLKVENGFYAVDELTAPAVRLIFETYANGATYADIIDKLNEKGYKSANGKPFVKNSIHDILKNEKYTGVYVYGKTKTFVGQPRNSHAQNGEPVKVENAFPAIISRELWDATQTRLKSRAYGELKSKKPYLLSGLVYCGLCKASMQGDKQTKEHGGKVYDYNYYRCRKAQYGKCSAKQIKAELLERLVIDNLKDLAENSQITARIASKTTAEIDNTNADKKTALNALKREEKQILKNIDNLLSAIEKGEFSDLLSERLNNRRAELSAVRERIDKMQDNSAKLTVAKIRKLLNDFKKIKKPSKRSISALLRRIEVLDGEIKLFFIWD